MSQNKNVEVAVLYIAFKEYGLSALNEFLSSYRNTSAGLPHQLHIALKGFSDPYERQQYMDATRGLDCKCVDVENAGYDIGTYREFVSITDYPYYFFLNSKSRILSDNWLAKVYRHACLPNVGLAGATASFESLLTDHLQQRQDAAGRWWPWREIVRYSWLNELRHRLYFPAFPNPHLRTNAFMIRREEFLKLQHRPIVNRIDAARFENGRNSISRQIKDMGLDVLVVGHDGDAYGIDKWSKSGTFWQGNQANLLVADNQTEKYDLSSDIEKKTLSAKAWDG